MSSQPILGSQLRKELVSRVIRDGFANLTQQLAQYSEAMRKDFEEKGFSPADAQREVNAELEEMFLNHGVEVRRLRQMEIDSQPSVPVPLPNKYGLWNVQARIHDEIINNPRVNFLITGTAGSGKTRLMTVLAENFSAKNVKVFRTAITSQLAAQFHEGFNFSVLLKTPPSNFDVILIDHGNLLPEESLQKLDDYLKESTGKKEDFGGKQICIFADFQQILPYTEDFKNTTEQSLAGKEIISKFKSFSLGNSSLEVELRNSFKEENLVSTIPALIHGTFGSALSNSVEKFETRIILSPSNQVVGFLNREILKEIPGEPIELRGWSEAFSTGNDKLTRKDCYAAEKPGIANHSITLKPNSIIALLRTQDGVPKGTRLIFLENINKNSVKYLRCRALSGLRKGQEVQVHQYQYPEESCTINYKSGKTFEFFLRRKQFPIALAFATTIHQAQGQFFDRVGFYNMDTAFEKELKYTAITRCRTAAGIRVFVDNSRSFI